MTQLDPASGVDPGPEFLRRRRQRKNHCEALTTYVDADMRRVTTEWLPASELRPIR